MSTALLSPTTGSRYTKTSAEARPNRLPLAYTLWAGSMLTVGLGVAAAFASSPLWVAPTGVVAVALLTTAVVLAVRSPKPAKPTTTLLAYMAMFGPWMPATMSFTTMAHADAALRGLPYAFAGMTSALMLLIAAGVARREARSAR